MTHFPARRRPRSSSLPLVVALALAMVAVRGLTAQEAAPAAAADDRAWPPVATFSIVGYDPDTGEAGVAVQSRVFSVGNGVIWGEAGVGVVATQAIVDVCYGPRALELLGLGYAPEVVVETILAADPDPDPERWSKLGRQFSVMDARGNVATHSGPEASEWAGHRIGRHVSARGNILAGDLLLHDMGPELADICGPGAEPGEVRTSPLTGLRFRSRLLHDCRASGVPGDRAPWRGGPPCPGGLGGPGSRAASAAAALSGVALTGTWASGGMAQGTLRLRQARHRRGSVSGMRHATCTPDRNVRTATAPIAVAIPKRSASAPATSAPTA